MTERTFQFLEHTADKGVAATGKTMAEAFENAAYGMFSLFVDLSKYLPTTQREFAVNADDVEQLLWAWLSDLHFNFEVNGELPVDFQITGISDTGLSAIVSVRPVGEDIEWLGSPVKAVTFHQLKVEQTDEGWRVQAYVDV
ncbi:MAG: archease [Armatimonadetes bacterium]|nr:archease [Armatimonadota bacterium]